jgi:hypothetical protein
MWKRQCANLQNGLLATPNHGAVDGLRHGLMQILAAMLEDSHENAPGEPFSGIALNQLVYQTAREFDKTSRNANQGGIAAEERAGHRKNGLDFDIAGWPVAHHAYRKSLALGPGVFSPSAMQSIGPEFAGNDWFQSAPPQPHPKKNDPGNIVEFTGVQAFRPAIKNVDDVIRRNLRVENHLTQCVCGIGHLCGCINRMYQLSRQSTHDLIR